MIEYQKRTLKWQIVLHYRKEDFMENALLSMIPRSLIPRNRRLLRAMIVGYYVDKDGLATDPFGKSLGEQFPGQLLERNPKKLFPYHSSKQTGEERIVDIDGYNHEKAFRVKWENDEFIKKFISEIEIPDDLGISELYAILANTSYELSDGTKIDLTRFKQQIVEGFRVWKNSTNHPYYLDTLFIERIANGVICDYCCLNLARLRGIVINARTIDFLTKTSVAELNQVASMLRPENWEIIFPKTSLLKWRGSVGQLIHPMKLDEIIGKTTLITGDETADEDNFLLSVIVNFLNPASAKVARMLSHLKDDLLSIYVDEMSDEKINAFYNLSKELKKWEQYKVDGTQNPYTARTFNFDFST